MRPLLLVLLSLPLLACAQPAVMPAPVFKPDPPLRARLDRDTVRAAVATLPAEVKPNPRRHEADTLGTTANQRFAKDFASARLPDCLHADGLKNQPTFFLGGVLALPFIAVAKLRGVCR